MRPGQPPKVTPRLGSRVYDFPVVGPVSWGNTYGEARSDVSGGWHHGEDLFAPIGTPVVAVSDGTVYSVGWNRIGGWRLWLADGDGNAFYYAHLSGYTALARNNRRVRRGQVLGFVGNTGSASTTPDHLHFEVHPNATLYLGYDGAVDPTTYLTGWHKPDRIKKLPPAALPPGPASGPGVLRNLRRLLALYPPPRVPKTPRAAAATPAAPLRLPAGATRAAPEARGGLGGAFPATLLVVLAAALGLLAHRRRTADSVDALRRG